MTSTLYAENAFRVLDLPISATEREIRRRVQERRLQAELNAVENSDMDRIRKAEVALDDPRGRLREEILAIHLARASDFDFSDQMAVSIAEECPWPLKSPR